MLAEVVPPLSPSDITTVIDRLFTSGPYVVVGVTAIVVLWKYVVREWMDKHSAERRTTSIEKNAELNIRLEIAKAQQSTAEAIREHGQDLVKSADQFRIENDRHEKVVAKLTEHAA